MSNHHHLGGSRYVGRVGVLAVVLGVGVAVGPAIAGVRRTSGSADRTCRGQVAPVIRLLQQASPMPRAGRPASRRWRTRRPCPRCPVPRRTRRCGSLRAVDPSTAPSSCPRVVPVVRTVTEPRPPRRSACVAIRRRRRLRVTMGRQPGFGHEFSTATAKPASVSLESGSATVTSRGRTAAF